MTRSVRNRLKPVLLACAMGAAGLASPAFAQQVDPNKLLELMVAKGLVSRAEADAMIAEASTRPVRQAEASIPAGGIDADGTQTIPYVPQVVRDQIKAELRAELAGQAQAEGWAKPGETPEWTRRISLYGDVRLRGEQRFYDNGNSDIFTDFGAINHGDPQNINSKAPGWIPPAFVNTLEDRRRFRLRARLGVKARIDDWISADVRVATGSDNSPVSTNQTLGADGTGKYQLWVDRAAIRLTPLKEVNIDLGRFANPFWTSDLLYDYDMNFDGVAVSGSLDVDRRLRLFGTAGAFPVFNTALNFGSRNAPEGRGGPYKSRDKYLFAVQAGVEVKPVETVGIRLAGAYFRYTGVDGRVSSPCYWYELVCSTDATRPAFQQFGNTMFPIRNIIPDPNDPVGSPANQYFGLASRFRILNLRAAIDYRPSERFGVRAEGDYVRNLDWDRSTVAARAVNNLGPDITVPNPDKPGDTMKIPGTYQGGNSGWGVRLTIGSVLNLNGQGDWQAKPGDWNAFAAYRRLESDAVIDGFADSDLHIGGTNNKGWSIGGNYAFARNTIVGVRWLSADTIADAPFSVDRLFVDIMTRF